MGIVLGHLTLLLQLLDLVVGFTTDLADRAYFFTVATTMMRRVLVDHARRQAAAKRGAAPTRVTLSESLLPTSTPALDMLALDEALSALELVDERLSRVAALRIYGGLRSAEVAEALGLSRRTAERDWKAARAWLRLRLRDGDDG